MGLHTGNRYYYVWAVILGVLVFDQGLKILIKTNMTLGYKPVFGDWFIINFIENPGMAFGVDIPTKFGKPLLTIFRLVAAFFIAWYLRSLIKKEAPTGFIICLSFIFVGAIGNIFDSLFYGIMFNESTRTAVATIFPDDGGYAHVLYGKVVDMFYFPIIKGHYPDWVPRLGGQDFTFFNAIFNVADAAISVGVASILIFQRKYLKTFS
ncbi:MAG: lipoprotein signal peptidase [Bacteroidales bacterium]|nr:lipoprotein signal peptidase [Bacteroidales bacterium]